MEEFGGLCDFVDTFSLVRGKKKKRPDDDDEEVGEFKVGEAYVVMCMIRKNCSPICRFEENTAHYTRSA